MKACEIFSRIIESKEFCPYSSDGKDVQHKEFSLNGRAIIAFQGSRSKRDWVNNFRFIRKVYKNQESCIVAHGGFVSCWKSVRDMVIGNFEKIYNENTSLPPLICGHSYGGALAVLASEDIHYHFHVKPLVVTFGAPNVAGSKKTVEYLLSCGEYFQYAQRNDMVPSLPPFPWYHQVNMIPIGEEFSLREWFKPGIYHQLYDVESEYRGMGIEI